MFHYVYMLQSLKDNRYYTGETSNVEERLLFHKLRKATINMNGVVFLQNNCYIDKVSKIADANGNIFKTMFTCMVN